MSRALTGSENGCPAMEVSLTIEVAARPALALVIRTGEGPWPVQSSHGPHCFAPDRREEFDIEERDLKQMMPDGSRAM
jgi:hypothetical protein